MHKRQSGFSLIELIMVIIILSVAAVPILGQFTQVASTALIDENIQTASQLAQERAEDILALRRNQGYDAIKVGTSNDVLTGHYSSFSRTVIVTEQSGFGACATGATCKSVAVTVERAQRTRAEITYILVDY